MTFRNGYLYHKFAISRLAYEDVCPMIDEVRRYQVDTALLEENGGYDSD